MTTTLLDNHIFAFNILLSWRLPRKTGFWDDFVSTPNAQGYVNGGFQTVVRVLWGNEIPAHHFNLDFTPVLPQFYLF